MKKIKYLAMMGMFIAAPLMAAGAENSSGVVAPTTTPTAAAATVISAVTGVKGFLTTADGKSLTEMQVGKVLGFASQLYRKKLKSLGFVRVLGQDVEQLCAEAAKYSKHMAGKLGISEDEFNSLFKKTETLLDKTSIDNADDTLKAILKICVRISSKKMVERIVDAGVNPVILGVLGNVADIGLKAISGKISADGCCGTVTQTLLDVISASKEPVLE